MVIELGHFALILALVIAALQTVVPWLGAGRGHTSWMTLGQKTSVPILGLCAISFLALTHAYALSDFSVRNVAENSHTLKPILYKITGTWGNHEGSMLLWACVLAFWTMLLAHSKQALSLDVRARALAIQAFLCLGVFSFILFTSNPFLRLSPAPEEGLGLNPLLQDPLLALHPPFLYMGYVGFSVVFSLALAGLITGKIDRDWARICLPWVRAAWVFLTIGIGLGSFWAYYELGWGGFWFWDPVENASLLPWLSGTALLHCLLALERKGQFAGWCVFLAILSFGLSLLGTFLVRSGVLTSVHAFAVDPARGLFILGFLATVMIPAFLLFARKVTDLKPAHGFAPFSREGGIFINNLLLFTLLVMVFVGTLYPLFVAALGGQDVSVGAPYYNRILVIILPVLSLAFAAAPILIWGQDALRTHLKKIILPVAFSVAVGILGLWLKNWPVSGAIAITCGLIVVTATVYHFLIKTAFLTQWSSVTFPYVGMILAHSGLGLLMIGFVTVTQLKEEKLTWVEPGQNITLDHYTLHYTGTVSGLGPNYNKDEMFLTLQDSAGRAIAQLTPQKNWYPVAEQTTSEVDLFLTPTGSMIYAVAGDQDDQNPNRWTLRAYYHPLVIVLLMGGILMALGGTIAFFQRPRP